MEYIDELRLLKEQVKFKGRFSLPQKFESVVLAGMGGSGISNKVFQEIYSEKPVFIVNDYNIPKFISKSTLFIAVSYSGNTEEVVTATKSAISKGAYVITISAGGILADYGNQHVHIPRADLQPRAAMGYMLMPLLRSFGLVSDADIKEAYSLLLGLDRDHNECLKHAEAIVKQNAIPITYGAPPFKAIAYRWKTQFNENSKVMSYSSDFPELDHNDVLSLAKTYRKKDFYFMVFESEDERIKRRITVTGKITKTNFNMIKVKGKTPISKIFYLIHFGDYITYGLGTLRGLDPGDRSLLEKLKKMLKR